jgi:hypothetical protein
MIMSTRPPASCLSTLLSTWPAGAKSSNMNVISRVIQKLATTRVKNMNFYNCSVNYLLLCLYWVLVCPDSHKLNYSIKISEHNGLQQLRKIIGKNVRIGHEVAILNHKINKTLQSTCKRLIVKPLS